MNRALFLSFIIAASAAGPARAFRALTPPAPEFPARDIWLNSVPMSLAALKERRVVLVAFINTANVNSMRALKALNAWDRAWSLKGLMVIGVHTPTFTFQRDPAALQRALRAYGVQFPVVMDDDRRLWRAYANAGWPAFYLIDGEGRLVYEHLGEDRYAELEAQIRQAIGGLPDERAPEGPAVVRDAPLLDCGASTPEISLSAGGRVKKASDPRDRLIFSDRDGEVDRQGAWYVGPDGPALDAPNPDRESLVRVYYRGAQALALLGPGARPSAKFFLRQDQLWLHSLNAGPDVKFDKKGRSYVLVDVPRLYDVADNPNDDAHALEVIPVDRGSAVHGFSFSNRCLTLSRSK